MFNWDVYYKHVMKSVEDGTWKVDTPFWGMKEGCVGLSPWGPNVPKEVQELVESEYAKFVSEEYDASFPFSRGYMRQDGTIVPPGSGRTEVDSMDHYVNGVITPMQ
jgi:basic membrane lipoprotein Med (substrate-binding protein (PBP1-ABC) superfamily)